MVIQLIIFLLSVVLPDDVFFTFFSSKATFLLTLLGPWNLYTNVLNTLSPRPYPPHRQLLNLTYPLSLLTASSPFSPAPASALTFVSPSHPHQSHSHLHLPNPSHLPTCLTRTCFTFILCLTVTSLRSLFSTHKACNYLSLLLFHILHPP